MDQIHAAPIAEGEFQCALCGRVYRKGRSEEDVMAEAVALFGEVDDDDLETVCDACFKQMTAEMPIADWRAGVEKDLAAAQQERWRAVTLGPGVNLDIEFGSYPGAAGFQTDHCELVRQVWEMHLAGKITGDGTFWQDGEWVSVPWREIFPEENIRRAAVRCGIIQAEEE